MMATTERIIDPDTGEHLGTIAWPDRDNYPHAYYTLNPGEDVQSEIIEDSQRRRLDSYEKGFQAHLDAVIRYRRESFQARQEAMKYAAISWFGAAVSIVALFWILL